MATPHEPQRPSLTVKDVLQAIFFPPVDRTDFRRLALRDARGLLPSLESTGETYDLPTDLHAPAVVSYDDSAISSVENVSPARLATLGIGTIVAILISYLAQTALSSPGGGGFLLTFMAAG